MAKNAAAAIAVALEEGIEGDVIVQALKNLKVWADVSKIMVSLRLKKAVP